MKTLIQFVLFSMILAIAACETPIPRRDFPEMTFTHLPSISLDVATIDIIQLFDPPLKPPHVEHEMPIQPHMAVSRWVSDRLKPTSSSGHAKVTIRDASVIEERLKSVGGVRGAFTTEQSERYVGKIEVEIKAVGGRGLRAASAVARTQRSRTIAEDASLRQRESFWFELTERMMQDFDRTFEAQIRQHLTAFLK